MKPEAGLVNLRGYRQYTSFAVTTELLRVAFCVWAVGFVFALAGFVFVSPLCWLRGLLCHSAAHPDGDPPCLSRLAKRSEYFSHHR